MPSPARSRRAPPGDDDPDPPSSVPRRVEVALVAFLLSAFAGLAAVAALRLDPTSDEPAYVVFGRELLRGEQWGNVFMQTQGPLPLFAAQAFLGGFDDEALARGLESPEVLGRARLALVPFGLLAALGTYLWSRRAFGPRGGLLSLALFCLNPLMIGYSALVTVDMAFAALVLWASYLLWRFRSGGGVGTLVASGAFLGLALGSKFTAALVAPLLGVLGMVAAYRRVAPQSGRVRGAGAAALALLALVAASLVALHACYRFEPGTAASADAYYRSDPIARAMADPVAAPVLGLLPAPFLLGVDDQVRRAHGVHTTYFAGTFADRHPGYYLGAILLKTPLVALAALVVLLVRRVGTLRRGRPPAREASAIRWTLALFLFPLAYMSFFTTYSVGIRFALFLYPFLFVLLGGAASPWPARLPAPAVAAGVLVASLPPLAGLPNLIAYFNPLSGGPANARAWFADSCADWGQMKGGGRRLLEKAESEPFEVLRPASGPRLGRCAIYLLDLVQPDPEDPARARHWTDPFEPVRSVGSSWRLFDVTREAFEAAADRSDDPRVAVDLAVALAGAGDLRAARERLDALPEERAAPLRQRLDVLGDATAAPTARARAWLDLGHLEPALAELDGLPEEERDLTAIRLRVEALRGLGRTREVIAELEREGVLDADPTLVYELAAAYTSYYRLEEALEVLERQRAVLEARDGWKFQRAYLAAWFRAFAVPEWARVHVKEKGG